jgi:hypothetical protein
MWVSFFSPLYLSSLSFSLSLAYSSSVSSLCSTLFLFLLGAGCCFKLDDVCTCYQTEGRMKVMLISLHSQRHPMSLSRYSQKLSPLRITDLNMDWSSMFLLRWPGQPLTCCSLAPP